MSEESLVWLLKQLDEEEHQVSSALKNGSIADYAGYREEVGKIRGIQMCRRLVVEVYNRTVQEEPEGGFNID